ncbi:hypothetical protein [Alicyclobacillus acidocaldarius]|uniref:Uncharacterized protein n=1 Tax=Alicyclobacillus acidocaldarius subsp. acidocaldarius (strain ATCC 27009 / DSM 446 / BCRC 14685 / JCM 5260 / KCTC 1825 / NBRC 15652 / NCIMB 11725 / NRRL B-14509 / 104-IA) TaxID=521098 RepID=C8WSW3_ALIAD|nr:hypothetical protein [Alicyclobacillus acidocaldarius]ACV57619.1 hypothetical protein Aaci_0570 [Alicyclobacillus acidocaldarius subsp. acidocaldarius DSM 446]
MSTVDTIHEYFDELYARLEDEKEKVETALDLCQRLGLRVQLGRSKGDTCLASLEGDGVFAECEAPTMSGALMGALLAIRQRGVLQ